MPSDKRRRIWAPNAEEAAYALFVAQHAQRLVRDTLAGGRRDPDNLFKLVVALRDLDGVLRGPRVFEERARDLLDYWWDPAQDRAPIENMREGIDFVFEEQHEGEE